MKENLPTFWKLFPNRTIMNSGKLIAKAKECMNIIGSENTKSGEI
jgi:hypothetical protein